MKHRIAACLLLAVCLSAQAGPAPWYQWRSKTEGTMVCAQTTLGPGWEQASGPFKDSRCEKPALVK
ncbi:hypothetical protein [Janthinobacterium agaricidamnosum]|uniref:Secreted protein n=1 Tax=Janthinobacterium agaricidamnosum NBRC 102515 = DSM 9628 TaxID=1349767 RepID=W0V905_9BURK|nr:hypothetical protein [Janthinobacterium agaricidamnosum]CDG83757.1 putative uncharacterized protein [Janthinobacterium agaricidamnosum NBRC 102515 = DSM 9628]